MEANTTLAGCVNITSLTWPEGQHNVTVWANDSAGNLNTSTVTFTIDTTDPNVSIVYPIAYAAYTNLTFFNYSVVELNDDSCWYSTDNGVTNSTAVASGLNFSSVGLDPGTYNVTISCNDSAGNIGNDTIRFVLGDYNTNLQISKITASDAGAGDEFGYAVAISGEYVIVGAYHENETADNAGAAYIFKRTEAGQFEQVNKLLASDGGDTALFGSSVSISGDYAIVGAWGENNNGTNTGAAYIFKKNSTGQFEEVNKIIASDPTSGDVFGCAVSISGDYVIVGAYGDDEEGANAGAAYIFKKNSTGQFEELQKITGTYIIEGDEFGYGVSISGDDVVVGVPGDNTDTGSAYFFKRNLTSGLFDERNNLFGTDANMGDDAGRSVSISGEYAIIGAHEHDVAYSNTGAAHVFKKNGTGYYKRLNTIWASDVSGGAYYGESVSISGDYAIVGAFYDDTGGSAYILKKNSTGHYSELEKIVASDAEASDRFGRSVSISGDYMVIGAYYEDEGGDDAGAAYVFNIYGDTDGPEFNFTNQTAEYGTAFAYTVNVTDVSGVSCFAVNDTANFKINCSGYLENNTGLEVGLYQLNITTNDTISNNNSARMWVNVTDTTDPALSITYPANDQYVSPRTITINGTTTDLSHNYTNISVYNRSSGALVNSTINYSTSWSMVLGVQRDGNYTVNATAYDNASNSNSTTVNVTVDTTYPVINITYPANGSSYDATNLTLNWTYTEVNNDSCWYGLNGVNRTLNCSDYTKQMNVTDAAWNNITLWMNDTAGNLNFSNITIWVQTNQAPNKTNLNSPANDSWSSTATPTLIWLNATDNDGNNLSYNILVDNDSDFSSLAVNVSVLVVGATTNYTVAAALGEILHYWRVRAYDGTAYGNYSDTWQFRVDVTEPTIWNVSLSSSVALANARINISANVTDNLNFSAAWVNVTLPNSTVVSLTMGSANLYSALFTNTSATGLYNVTVYANDSAGNLNSSDASFIITTCITASDCGTNTANEFCQDNDVYGNYGTYSCSSPGTVSASCSYSSSSELTENCGDSFCYYSPNYCAGNNVVNDTICYNRGCSPITSACYSELGLNTTETVEICATGCSDGACVSNGTTTTSSSTSTTSSSTTTTVANVTTTTTLPACLGDTNDDQIVSDSELLNYVDEWNMKLTDDFNLLKVIDNWANGCPT